MPAAGVRIKGVQGHPGIFEFTWSMKNPDGRATFEWLVVDGRPTIRLRRAGDHSVFKAP